ncbi:MAG: magnesium transporter [Gammaproteobacteria bacterium]
MSTANLERELLSSYFARHPVEAAAALERLPLDELCQTLAAQQPAALARVFESLSPATWPRVLDRLPPDLVVATLDLLSPRHVAGILRPLDESLRARLRATLDPTLGMDVDLLLDCEPGSAGAMMDPRLFFVRREQPVSEALARLREQAHHRRYVRAQRIMLVAGPDGKLQGFVAIQDLALAAPDDPVGDYMQPTPAVVPLSASTEQIVNELTQHGLSSLPVVDNEGHLVGVVRHEELVAAAQENASVDLQTMFGASRDEKALSKPGFAVSKRLPWLQVNLLTAFLAAAVVGVFESTIAAYTALAVLLPVVAGQSGNTGAQALAVVIRGLALKEIATPHWRRVLTKETLVAFTNGLAVAATCALGVYVWSGSPGLTAVIGLSMVISMTIAGAAGAAIPILLTRFGQDPAQSSSIVLTTVTDVAGFFSFLGIATVFVSRL